MSTPLQIAQEAFTEWLRDLDNELHEAQIAHEKALGCLRNGDINAFGEAIGRMAGCVDIVRGAIGEALARGFDDGQPAGKKGAA